MNSSRRFAARRGATGGAERTEAYYRKVADQLIEQVKAGTARGPQAWQPGEKSMPCNVVTGKAYRGGNSVWLASVADRRWYGDVYRATGTYRADSYDCTTRTTLLCRGVSGFDF